MHQTIIPVAYVTKYWQTAGIMKIIKGVTLENGKYLHYGERRGLGNVVGPAHWHLTLEAAQAKVRKEAEKKLKVVNKQIEALKRLVEAPETAAIIEKTNGELE